MINISRDVWYIRFIMVFCDSPPTNVCQLIRYFLGNVLAWTVIAFIASIMLFMVLIPAFYAFGVVDDIWIFSVGVIFDGWILAAVIRQLAENKSLNKDWFYYDITPEIHTPSFLKIIWSWVRALHDKTCPLITMK